MGQMSEKPPVENELQLASEWKQPPRAPPVYQCPNATAAAISLDSQLHLLTHNISLSFQKRTLKTTPKQAWGFHRFTFSRILSDSPLRFELSDNPTLLFSTVVMSCLHQSLHLHDTQQSQLIALIYTRRVSLKTQIYVVGSPLRLHNSDIFFETAQTETVSETLSGKTPPCTTSCKC